MVQMPKSMPKSFFFFLFGILLITLVIVGCTQKVATNLPVQDVTILKSQSCGCCGVYMNYMQNQGFRVAVTNFADTAPVKQQYEIPNSMQSCHTTIIGDYFVEGHIPAEAIAKLVTEKPGIRGIAMPGMPYGSPGMPGKKEGPFVIYAIQRDGSVTEFMRI